MQCTRFEELLFETLEGRLDEPTVGRLRAHGAGCARCAELEALLTGETALEPPADLTASILAQTIGPEAPLQRAMRQLDLDLPMLAEMEPDERFLEDVMAATVEADRNRFWARAAAFWQTLVQRPRFALEGAYLGSIAMFLLVGLPGSPLAGVPEQVLVQLRDESGTVRTTVRAGAERVSDVGQVTWSRAGDVFAYVLPADSDGTATASAVVRSWRERTARLLQNIWRYTLGPAFEWIRGAWLNTFSRATETPLPETTTNDRNSHSA